MGRKKKTEVIGGLKEEVKDITKNVVETAKEEIKGLKVEHKKITKPQKSELIEISGTPKTKKFSRKELKEKAKKLAEKIEGKKTEELKEKLELSRKTLVPVDDYVKAGVYIGTKVITPHMRQFVYRRRNDGIAIINTNIVDEKLKEMCKVISKYKPEDFVVVCKRETGWKAVQKFAELTGARIFTKKYPAGILTNPSLPNFFETEMVFICDPWLDKNALKDGNIIKKKVFALCDTNNYTFGINFFVPCNNKSAKSIGLVFYILTREYLKANKIEKEIKIEDFVEEES